MRIVELLLDHADEGSEEFWDAVAHADGTGIAAVVTLAAHEDADVRLAVVRALPQLASLERPTEAMLEVAIGLTTDADMRERDWACFALGQQWREVDTPPLREALAARLDDLHRDTRSEALLGLAYRHDPRALPRVQAALSRRSGDLWRLEIEAAAALGDPQLHELVVWHRDGWGDPDDALAAEVACRLTDPDGPGEDVLAGVADLYRRRAHGRPEGDALVAWRLMDRMLDVAPYRARQFFDQVLARLWHDEAAVRELRERSALAQLAEC